MTRSKIEFMHMVSKVIALLSFFCFFLFATPQAICQTSKKVTFSNWNKKDGLPSSHILAIEQDQLGFLWIATYDGLCRYDGPNLVKVYREIKEGNKTNSLNSSNIRSLHCDREGILWIGTRFGGLTRFNPLTNSWKTFRHDPNQENSLSNDEVLTIFEDSQQRLWVGTEGGLNLLILPPLPLQD